jgi:hypothetical protein
MQLVNVVFKDEKALKVFKEEEDALDFIASVMKSESDDFRIEEFIVE